MEKDFFCVCPSFIGISGEVFRKSFINLSRQYWVFYFIILSRQYWGFFKSIISYDTPFMTCFSLLVLPLSILDQSFKVSCKTLFYPENVFSLTTLFPHVLPYFISCISVWTLTQFFCDMLLLFWHCPCLPVSIFGKSFWV
jgi:hypothetical protein